MLVACLNNIDDGNAEFLLKLLPKAVLERAAKYDPFSLIVISSCYDRLTNRLLRLRRILLELFDVHTDGAEGSQFVVVALAIR